MFFNDTKSKKAKCFSCGCLKHTRETTQVWQNTSFSQQRLVEAGGHDWRVPVEVPVAGEAHDTREDVKEL